MPMCGVEGFFLLEKPIVGFFFIIRKYTKKQKNRKRSTENEENTTFCTRDGDGYQLRL